MEAMTISEHARKCTEKIWAELRGVPNQPLALIIQKHMDAAIAEAVKPAIAELNRLLDATGDADEAIIQSEIDRLKTLIGEK